MPANQNNANLEKMAAAARDLAARLADMRVAVERMEASERMPFENQLDVLEQRQQTVVARLSQLHQTDASEFRAEFRRKLDEELTELQAEVRQVARRIVLP